MAEEARLAQVSHDGEIALIILDSPPVNALSTLLRRQLVDAIAAANDDTAVRAIVLTGAGRGFSGGADIRELGTPKASAQPNLLTLIRAVEQLSKPIIAGIDGVCMGGGLELALACHYRVAVPGAQIALPEVKLGLTS